MHIRSTFFAVAILLAGNCCAQVTRSFTEPKEQIEVSAAELGIVHSVKVKVGQTVTAGQLLGELNHGVLKESKRLALHRSVSTSRVKAAAADLNLKKTRLEKLNPLLQSGHANQSEVERARTEYAQSLAAYEVASDESIEAKIELARIEAQIAERQIRSPIDGVVINVFRRPGEYLHTNEPQFATVVDTSQLRARFFISTQRASTLQSDQPIKVHVGVLHKPVNAMVEFVSPITDSQSGTVRVDVLIDNSTNQLRSGVSCELVEQNPNEIAGS